MKCNCYIYFTVVSLSILIFLYILQQYVTLLCSYYSEKEVRFLRQQYVFISGGFTIQQNVAKVFKQVISSFLCFYYSIAWNQAFSSISMLLLFVFWSSVEFSISKYCFVCFYHLLEGQANMFFLFVFTSFSRMEPTLSQQQVFLFRFLSFSITEPI